MDGIEAVLYILFILLSRNEFFLSTNTDIFPYRLNDFWLHVEHRLQLWMHQIPVCEIQMCVVNFLFVLSVHVTTTISNYCRKAHLLQLCHCLRSTLALPNWSRQQVLKITLFVTHHSDGPTTLKTSPAQYYAGFPYSTVQYWSYIVYHVTAVTVYHSEMVDKRLNSYWSNFFRWYSLCVRDFLCLILLSDTFKSCVCFRSRRAGWYARRLLSEALGIL